MDEEDSALYAALARSMHAPELAAAAEDRRDEEDSADEDRHARRLEAALARSRRGPGAAGRAPASDDDAGGPAARGPVPRPAGGDAARPARRDAEWPSSPRSSPLQRHDARLEELRLLQYEADASRCITSAARYRERCEELRLLQEEAAANHRRLVVCMMLHEHTGGGHADLVQAILDLGVEYTPVRPSSSPPRPDAQHRWDRRFRDQMRVR